MRAAVFAVVLAIHVALFLLFSALRGTVLHSDDWQAPSVAFFLEPTAAPATASQSIPAEQTLTHPTTRTPARPPVPAAMAPQPQPETQAITPPAEVPDWRHELQIAANNQIQSDARRRSQPSPLAPHDFSRVKPGSTDDTRREFGWSHAATHRVEEIPSGGLLIHLNERCAIAWVIFPFPVCQIGKIPTRGDLFDHMKDAPDTPP
jgi:hypothetical protein